MLVLRDARLKNFSNSILVVLASNLANGPIYFNCAPNFTVSLFDNNILRTLTLDIQLPSEMLPQSKNAAIMYRVYYKVTQANITPKALKHSTKRETLLL